MDNLTSDAATKGFRLRLGRGPTCSATVELCSRQPSGLTFRRPPAWLMGSPATCSLSFRAPMPPLRFPDHVIIYKL